MSAPGTSGETLSRLLTKEEYAAVIAYAHERNLGSDDALLFMLAVLKIFDHLIEDFVTIVDLAETRKAAIDATFAAVPKTIAQTLDRHVARLTEVLNAGTTTLVQHVGGLQVAIGEMKALKGELETITRDAREAFAAHEALRGNGHALSDAFRTAALQALHRYLPTYGEALGDQLTIELGKLRRIVIGSMLGGAALMALVVGIVLTRL